MPGLLRGIARTAIISGTATAVSNRVSRRQAGRWAQQDQQEQATYQQPVYQQPPAPAPPPASGGTDMSSAIDQLRDLAQLKDQGILTEAEFEAQKRRILGA